MEETTEIYNTPVPEPGNMVLTTQAQDYLRQAGGWAKFLGIIGFIFTGFIFLGALSIGSAMTSMAGASPMFAVFAGAGTIITIIYLLAAVLCFFLSLYVYQFGDRVKNGVLYGDSQNVASGLGKLKSLFKLYGIFIIVYLAFVILIFIAFAIGMGMSSHMR
ncbi:DUF5362 family protein [Mucilaginibacter sp.]